MGSFLRCLDLFFGFAVLLGPGLWLGLLGQLALCCWLCCLLRCLLRCLLCLLSVLLVVVVVAPALLDLLLLEPVQKVLTVYLEDLVPLLQIQKMLLESLNSILIPPQYEPIIQDILVVQPHHNSRNELV